MSIVINNSSALHQLTTQNPLHNFEDNIQGLIVVCTLFIT